MAYCISLGSILLGTSPFISVFHNFQNRTFQQASPEILPKSMGEKLTPGSFSLFINWVASKSRDNPREQRKNGISWNV